MKRGLVVLVAGLSLAGCAGLQSADTASAERALTAAGFQPRPAATPEKLAQLQSLTPRRVLLQQPQGHERRYVYADPKGCACLYVGGEEQYAALRRNTAAAIDRFFAVEGSGDTIDWGLWEIGPR
jgi:hypothetical protein